MASPLYNSTGGQTATPWSDNYGTEPPTAGQTIIEPSASTPVLNSSMELINSWKDGSLGLGQAGRGGNLSQPTVEGAESEGADSSTSWWPRSADGVPPFPGNKTVDSGTAHPLGPLTSLLTPEQETRLHDSHVADYNHTGAGFTNSTLGITNITQAISGSSHVGQVATNVTMAWDSTVTPSGWWDGADWNYTMDNGTEFLNDSDYTEHIDVLEGFPYPSMYSWPHIIISSIVVTFIMLLIVLGNGLVCVAIAKDRNLKGLQNWYIASLAISDLFVGLFIMPLSLANELMGYWVFGNVLCELWLATDVLLCTASILNLCLISMDRYWSITRVTYVKLRTKQRVIVMIAIVWLLSMIICFPPLAGWKRPQPTKNGFPKCVLSEEPGYVLYSTMGSFYIPLIIMVLVYFKIYLAARSRARRTLKKEKPVANNGKSASNTSTTSFSNPSDKHSDKIAKMSPAKESLSDEEDDNLDSTVGSEGGHSVVESTAESGKENPAGGMKLSVTNHHARFLTTDEKHKLLSDDTDSACDTPMRQKIALPRARKIQFSEDTDSTSDCSYSKPVDRAHEYKEGVKGEENLKPLLEDSQLESDSQRESDKNCNKIQSGGTNHKELDVPRVEVSGPGDEKNKRKKSGLNEKAHGHDKRKHLYLSPANLRSIGASVIKRHKEHKKPAKKDDPDKFKRKIARARERRATIVLGIVMASFIGCWLPFFGTYLVTSLAGLQIPYAVFSVIFWLGYFNSALNPIIYTIFNRDFKHAFQRILFGRRQRR